MRQLERLRSTPSFCVPEAPCTPGLGIQRWTEAEFGTWARQGAAMEPKRVVRFVPASGAASRMFKALVARDPAAIEQLKPEFREILLLWGVEGLKYREIAEILEVPIGTVMSRLHRARKLVADALGADPSVSERLGIDRLAGDESSRDLG